MEAGGIPSQSALIRAWLELQSAPRTCVEIAVAIGKPGDVLVAQNVHRMFRDGILARTGRCRSYAFTLARDVIVRPRMPKDEYLRRAREANRKRHARAGGRTKEQYLADLAAQHAAWLARKAAAKAKRDADRMTEGRLRQAEQKAASKAPRPVRPKAPPKPRAPRLRALDTSPLKPAPAPAPVESVADYLRRGGKIIRLAPHVVSQPLRITLERMAA